MSENRTVIVRDKTFNTIQSAVNKMVDFIRPTLGPAENKVIIDKMLYKLVVDDGVQIARDFELEDPAENAVVRIIREAAIKTNDRVGDGTTGSLIILQAIINEVARRTRRDSHKVVRELKRGLEEEILKCTSMAKLNLGAFGGAVFLDLHGIFVIPRGLNSRKQIRQCCQMIGQ